MKKILSFLVVGLVSLLGCFSCTDDSPAPPAAESPAEQTAPENPYLISQEQAIENLKEFASAFYGTDSRSGEIPEIAEVLSCNANSPQSRSEVEDSILNDVMLYFVNFQNDEGFAVMSGDIRIPQTLLCITKQGRITKKELQKLTLESSGGIDIHTPIPQYPTSGPTFFTDPKYPNELFINPNIGDFYVESEDDTLIGNYEFEIKDDEEDTMASDLEYVCNFEPGYFVAKLCIDYAKIISQDRQFFHFNDSNDQGFIGPGGGGGTMPITHTEEKCTSWVTKAQVTPMLTNYEKWHQWSPFNDLYPKRRAFLIFGAQRRAPAGCFPLAIAKIMAYFRFPGSITFNNFLINWDVINQNENSTYEQKSKAHLLFFIAQNCKCWYFYQGTFTFPNKAVDFLKQIFFQDVEFVSYNSKKAIQMIDNGYPTIIYGMPGLSFWNAHAWNIDGYKIQEREKNITYYNGSNVVKRLTVTEIQEMIHCDFGWAGKCNGYFCGDIFDFKSSSTEYDDSENSDKNHSSYNKQLHLLNYKLPI